MINTCWICSQNKLKLVKPSNIDSSLTSQSFAITDKQYGVTGDIFLCNSCGFLQCHKLPNVLKYYEEMEDKNYDETSDQRSLQMKKVLKCIEPFKNHGRLLDIGAGSGLLVREADVLGYEAEGIEPSVWLQKIAENNNLKVHLGTLPHSSVGHNYDIITLVDIIEHVSAPVDILKDVYSVLDDNGICLLITPDVKSLMARILKWKWWHYRIAHIGYFNKETIELCLKNAGFKIVSISRPIWYFPANYLIKRIMKYLPSFMNIPLPAFLSKITIPLNLYDSIQVIFVKDKEK
jgi:2-polyprenyl-3-methyl-5-hydroxy-6-metoxy-1,4-benzoquinol methylase